MRELVLAGLRYYRGTHAMVVAGVTVAVAVLAGALLVGASVRESLRDLALARLGQTDVVLSSTAFFREALAGEIERSTSDAALAACPIVAMNGAVTSEDRGRTAARVQVFGIDDRFVRFHNLDGAAPASRDAWVSEALARELGVSDGEGLLLKVAKPTDIPLSTLQGRREDAGERIRLVVGRVIDSRSLGEFSLAPAQGPALTLFVPLTRLQRDLDLVDRVNAILVRGKNAEPEGGLAPIVRRAAGAAIRADDLGLRLRADEKRGIEILESTTGLIPPAVVDAATRAAGESGRTVRRVLTYLANSIRLGDRAIPYSVVSAVEATDDGVVRDPAPDTLVPPTDTPVPIWLNEWAMQDLGASIGDVVSLEYYLWSDESGLGTGRTALRLAGAIPMTADGGDATYTPAYPGITDAADVSSWDPPFPVDLKRVRPKDEEYWDRWRTAPKAFVPLTEGQRDWPSPFGTISSLRASRGPGETRPWLFMSKIDPFTAGFAVREARAEALAAAEGTTDFGEYFVYFSFFLVVAGLLLAALFFALAIEQRTREIGILGAVGFGPRAIRSMFLTEAALLAAVGAAAGILGAIGYAALILYGLRHWWVDAVGTTALTLHIDWPLVAAGAAGAVIAAFIALLLSLRSATRRTPRDLLAATPSQGSARQSKRSRSGWLAAVFISAALALAGLAAASAIDQVAGFFGAGGALTIGGLLAFNAWLRRPPGSAPAASISRLGAAYARWRPTRSVLSAALITFACFVVVSVGSFRRDPSGIALARESGTGGFALMAESVAPLMHNPNTPGGRQELALAGDPVVERLHVARFRLRPGDEASCLTLYQPKNPRIVAPEPSFLAERRFAFAASMAETAEERENPWRLLDRRFADHAIPAIVDQTSLTYVFHLAVGDDFVLAPGGQSEVRLRIVGALADSVLQSELIINEADFVRLFPRQEGYRVWLIETPPDEMSAVTATLEGRLADFGVDVTDTRARLAAYHRVENTYLSTFQLLGALGLLMGTIGLGAVLARNVLERRRELALLTAVGFTARQVRTLILSESALLVCAGLTLGTVTALVAVAPALLSRAAPVNAGGLALLLAGVTAAGLLSAVAAARYATRASVVSALKSE